MTHHTDAEQERASLGAFIDRAGRDGFDTAHTFFDCGEVVFLNPDTADLWGFWQAARRDTAAPVTRGWKLVPEKSTEAMARAFRADDAPECFGMTTLRCADFAERYAAMLAAAPAHPAEGVPAPMPVPYPHHCTARTADGFCEECEGHAQAMAEWNAERAALAAAHPTQQGMDDLHKQMLKALESVGAHTVTDCDGDEITAYFCNWQAISDAKRAAQAKQGGAA